MAKWKVTFDREGCIGAGACVAVARKFWEMREDGKPDIVGGTKSADGKHEEIIIEAEEDFRLNKDAADACPVLVIHIYNMDTGEKIV